MGDQWKLAVMRNQPNGTNWDLAGIPQVNSGLGLMGPGAANAYANQIQAAQELPPTVSRMQGGFGLDPRMLGLLSQLSQPAQQPAVPPVSAPSPFQMRPTIQRPMSSPNWWR